jgi:predicted DNA repair protein MutK
VAGASLLALLDDIALLMDDVSVMTKVAARKTAGVLGDDLAVNAEKVTGVAAERELPVVFAVFRGSLINKAILVPAALLVASFAPRLITPLLIAGGLFLCFEGFEKVWHSLRHSRDEKRTDADELRRQLEAPDADPLSLERKRIRGAVRTDMILSAEIIVITLGIVGDAPLGVRAAVLTAIALAMTVGVYGLVALIVKMDDAGLHLYQRDGEGFSATVLRGLGRGLLALAPRFMSLLTVVGTLAMFLVGGGILVHGLPALDHAGEAFVHAITAAESGLLATLLPQLFAAVAGLLAGAVLALLVGLAGRFRSA